MAPTSPHQASGKASSTLGESTTHVLGSSSQAEGSSTQGGQNKKKKHRAGKKRRNRRQSFATPSDHGDVPSTGAERPSLLDVPEGTVAESQFSRIDGRRDSNTSIGSEALLDHREQLASRPRRQSLLHGLHQNRSHQSRHSYQEQAANSTSGYDGSVDYMSARNLNMRDTLTSPSNDRTPLLYKQNPSKRSSAYGGLFESGGTGQQHRGSFRRPSVSSTASRNRKMPPRQQSYGSMADNWDVNNPPSQPGSPRVGGDHEFDEVMLPAHDRRGSVNMNFKLDGNRYQDTVIDVDQEENNPPNGTPRPPSSDRMAGLRRRTTNQDVVEDVCLPFDQMTDIVEEDFMHLEGEDKTPRRSRKRPWPDFTWLEEHSQAEKEERTMEGIRAKKVNEPELVGGRLRPSRVSWQPEDEEAPFRFTYFNEELDSSLRSYTLSGLQQLGLSFRELFVPDPPELDGDSSDEEDEYHMPERTATPVNGQPRMGTRQSSILDFKAPEKQATSQEPSGQTTPTKAPANGNKPKKYGPRPVFWLDVLAPTYEEMRVLSRAFGIHKLTAEDIMEQEAREKVELFRNYYFVNYRTFEQDQTSAEFMDPVNMYFIVFKGGVISFHFSQMPHPPNVRRRIRQLAEHQYTDSDWISYAIIDNITDAYAPLIEQVEKDVDDIDDEILRLHTRQDSSEKSEQSNSSMKAKEVGFLGSFKRVANGARGEYEKLNRADTDVSTAAGGNNATSPEGNDRNMLFRVGECRKKVMGLYRLLGNKADVIKGLAKRCNEQWQVAPRSDVGLYLGDIQDHIVTMTGNLTHYESILSRAHSNYLAQINIKMTERAEQTNDVLGKLTVLGTIVLPMNIITGMWGMNVLVPGQEVENLNWFWGITAGLVLFGMSCFFIARKLYRVV
ncbi:MAG: CorA metal ion transporter [Alyxoria varia]|nr:MAG: CorA metal ion transporter [Alyxoria varia]